jgi:hypothetical protein
MLVTAIGGIVAAHRFAGLNYPVDRLGLYLVLLFGLAWAISVSVRKSKAVRWIHAVLASVLIVQFATQLQTRYFFLWKDDVLAKDIARRLQAETRDRPPGSVRVSASFFQQPALEFYRDHYSIASLQPIARYDAPPLHGFDFYAVSRYEDPGALPQDLQRLRVLVDDPVSGVLLAQEP